MGKKLLLFCCMLISYIFSAQQLEITGSVTNHEKLAVENATVYLLKTEGFFDHQLYFHQQHGKVFPESNSAE
ncbi:hypothetical protein [Chryseobacterium camelliae]|uniref:Uncharacterized protein n=1 Tax=Chryseobacterium camelliae TaxID=1265445 RepID=A0ABU0TGC1_9FLAO|nr:hypothetical protein [Chryseobacterium camelliae]MDQ1095178.1 hypothetical protein [Chryseobacterium camelliae]